MNSIKYVRARVLQFYTISLLLVTAHSQSLNLDKGIGCSISIQSKDLKSLEIKNFNKLVIIRKSNKGPTYYYYEEGQNKCIEIVNESLDLNLFSEFLHQVVKKFNENDIEIVNCKNDCPGIEKVNTSDENKRLFYQCGEDLNSLKRTINQNSFKVKMKKINLGYDNVSNLIKSSNCIRENGRIITDSNIVNKIKKQTIEANDMDVRSRSRATY